MPSRPWGSGWPRCNDLKELQQHLEDWEHHLRKYGKDLLNSPDDLFQRALELIPSNMEDEIMARENFTTFEEAIAWCRKRTLRLRHVSQSKMVDKHSGISLPSGQWSHLLR